MSSAENKKFWRTVIKHRGILALGGVCVHCGKKFLDVQYDFHHLNPEEKSFSFSTIQTNSSRTWITVRDELKKCCLLCANCHRLYHAGGFELEQKQYFNEEYYDWELMKQPIVFKRELDISKDLTEQLAYLEDEETLRLKHVCPKCGGYKSTTQAKFCENCAKEEQRKVDRPDRETLKQLIRNKPFTEIGRMYNISDNAIRKWCVAYNLPKKKKEINQYSDEEWSKI